MYMVALDMITAVTFDHRSFDTMVMRQTQHLQHWYLRQQVRLHDNNNDDDDDHDNAKYAHDSFPFPTTPLTPNLAALVYLTESLSVAFQSPVPRLAHCFDVPALKLLARDRFFYAAELCCMENESFPAVVDELYTTTSDTDVAMREIVCRLVGPNMLRHEQRARLEEVMRKHGDFAVAVMNHMAETQRCLWG
jgi:hypothetical protein